MDLQEPNFCSSSSVVSNFSELSKAHRCTSGAKAGPCGLIHQTILALECHHCASQIQVKGIVEQIFKGFLFS